MIPCMGPWAVDRTGGQNHYGLGHSLFLCIVLFAIQMNWEKKLKRGWENARDFKEFH